MVYCKNSTVYILVYSMYNSNEASEYPKLIYKHAYVYLSTECVKPSQWDRTRAGHRNKPSTVEVL